MSRRETVVGKSSPPTDAALNTNAKGDLVVDLDQVLNKYTASPRRRTERRKTDNSDSQLVRVSQEDARGSMEGVPIEDTAVPFSSYYSTRGHGDATAQQRTHTIVPPLSGIDKPLLSFSTARRTRKQSNQSTDDYGTYSSSRKTNHTGSASLARTASSSSSSHDDGLSTPPTSTYAYSPVMKQPQDEGRSHGKSSGEVGWSTTTGIPFTAALSSPPEDVASVSKKKRGSAGPGPAILDPRFSFPLRKNGGKPTSAPMTRSNDLSGNPGIQESYVASLGLTPLIADVHFADKRNSNAHSAQSSLDLSTSFDHAQSGSFVDPATRCPPSLRSAESEPSLFQTPLCPSIRSGARSRKNSKKANKSEKELRATSGRTSCSGVRGQRTRARTEPTSAHTSDVEDQNIAPLHISRSGRTRDASTPAAQIEMTFPAGPHLTHSASSSTKAFTCPHPRLHAFKLEIDVDVGPVEVLRSSSSLDWGSVRRVLHDQEEFQKERDEWSDASASAIGAKWNSGGRRRRRRHRRVDSGSGSDATVMRTLRLSGSAPALRDLASYGLVTHAKHKPLHRRDPSSRSQVIDGMKASGLVIPPPRRESLVQNPRHRGSSESSAITFPTQGDEQRSYPMQGTMSIPGRSTSSHFVDPSSKASISAPSPTPTHSTKNKLSSLSPNLHSLFRSNSFTAASISSKPLPSRPIASPSKSTMDGAGSFRPTRPPPPVPHGATPFSPLDNKKYELQLARLMTEFEVAPHPAEHSLIHRSGDEPIASISAGDDKPLRSGAQLPSLRSRATSGAPYSNLRDAVNAPNTAEMADSPLGRPSLATLRRAESSDFCPPHTHTGDDTFGVTGQRYSSATESFYSVDSKPPNLGDVLPSPISDYFGSLRNSYSFTTPPSPPIGCTSMMSSSPHSRESVGSVASGSRNISNSRPPSAGEGSLNLDEEGYTFEDLFFRPPPTRHDSTAFSEDQYPLSVTTSFFPGRDVQTSPELYEPNRAQHSYDSAVPSHLSTRLSAPPFNRTATAGTYGSETSESFETAEEGSGSPTLLRKDSPFENAPLEQAYSPSRPSSPLAPHRLSISTVVGVSPILIRVQDTASALVRPATPSSRSSPPPQSFLDLSASPDAAPSEHANSSFLFFEDASGERLTNNYSRRGPRLSQVPNDESVLPSFSPVASPRATMIADLHPDSSTSPSAMFIEVALALSREPSRSNLDMGEDEDELPMNSSFPMDVSVSALSSPRETLIPSLNPAQLLSPRLHRVLLDDVTSVAATFTTSGAIISVDPSRGSGLSAWSAVSKFPLPPSEEVEEEGVAGEADVQSTISLDDTPRPHSPVAASTLVAGTTGVPSVGSLLHVNDGDSEKRTIHSVRSMATLRRNRSAPNLSSRSSLTVDTDEWTVAASTIRPQSSEEANQSSDHNIERPRDLKSVPSALEDLPDAPVARCLDPSILSERLRDRRRVWSLGSTIRFFFTSSNFDGSSSTIANLTPSESKANSTQATSRLNFGKHQRTSSDPSVYRPAWAEGPEQRLR